MDVLRSEKVAFVDLLAQREALGSAIDDAIARVLAHGQFIMGPEVQELERRLAERAEVAHVVACSSGTDALLLPLLAWGVGPGDAVFVPSFTFTATAEVVALLGATPVYCDVLSDTFNLSPASLEAAIDKVVASSALQPRAVIPVDLFGQPADYREILAIAESAGLKVLADGAQSFGATLAGRPVGGLATATSTSFFPAKPLGCYGDGGAVFTDDDHLTEAMRSLRVHGSGSSKYETTRVGLNARLDTLQAAILLAKVDIFDRELERRAEVAARYTDSLGEHLMTPVVRGDRTSTWAQYTVQSRARDRLAASLRQHGIPTAIYYPRPLHQQPAFSGGLLAPGGCPTAEKLCDSVLSVPIHPYLRDVEQDRVIAAILSALRTTGPWPGVL